MFCVMNDAFHFLIILYRHQGWNSEEALITFFLETVKLLTIYKCESWSKWLSFIFNNFYGTMKMKKKRPRLAQFFIIILFSQLQGMAQFFKLPNATTYSRLIMGYLNQFWPITVPTTNEVKTYLNVVLDPCQQSI